MLLATDARRVGAAGCSTRRATLPAELRPVARRGRRAAAPRRCAGGRVYTDDVAPVEWLVDTSIVEVAAEGDR